MGVAEGLGAGAERVGETVHDVAAGAEVFTGVRGALREAAQDEHPVCDSVFETWQ
ncbi:MAG: hypothetical protein J6336_12590 [Kiritimatiellae bacterium]|nr:hypothetical protein [Kiritimatiellia bacterium]